MKVKRVQFVQWNFEKGIHILLKKLIQCLFSLNGILARGKKKRIISGHPGVGRAGEGHGRDRSERGGAGDDFANNDLLDSSIFRRWR